MDHFRELGYDVLRTSGSHGKFDVVAWAPGRVFYVQCKSHKAGGATVAERDAVRSVASDWRNLGLPHEDFVPDLTRDVFAPPKNAHVTFCLAFTNKKGFSIEFY